MKDFVKKAKASTDLQKAATLRKRLKATDYVAAKIAEGAATREEYADVLAERQEARRLINEYEAKAKEAGIPEWQISSLRAL